MRGPKEELALGVGRVIVSRGSVLLETMEKGRLIVDLIFGREATNDFEKRARTCLARQRAAVAVLENGGSLEQATAAARAVMEEKR